MKKKSFKWNSLIAVIIMLFSISCSETEQEEVIADNIYVITIFPRISIVSQDSNTADVIVEIEGYDGNLVSGAVVLVSNSVNGISKCSYDAFTGTYNTKFPIPYDGNFIITVNSIRNSIPLVFNIDHKQIIDKPIINVLEDSEGSSVLMGQSLDKLRSIQIGWTSCGEDIIYQITISTAFQTLYQASTEGLTHFIPGGTLSLTPGQTYYLQVSAQRILGDPFYITDRYYSAVIRKGETISFNAK